MSPVTKDELRRQIRASRRARSDADRRAAGLAIAEHAAQFVHGGPGAFTSFLSLPTEPPTDPLNERLLASSARVLVPKIVGSDLQWVALTPGAELTVGAMAIREPKGHSVPLRGVHTMFMPALAIDVHGNRLGQGGGFYDRALAAVPRHQDGGPLRVALVFADELREWLPTEWFDTPVDVVITPTGVRRFSEAPA